MPQGSDTEPSIVGRLTEVEALHDLIRVGRTVVISGAPGIGKSALAVEVIERVTARLGGEWGRIDLHRARTADETWAEVAAILDLDLDLPITDPKACAIAAGKALRARGVTGVLLDGGNLLGESSSALTALARCAQAPILITSRRRFALPGATSLELEGLSTDDAVRLYEQTSSRRGAGRGDHDDIIELVQRLEGHPLAILLAAARADLLPPRKLLARLDAPASRREGKLDGALEPRRGSTLTSLDSAIASSWELLGADERKLVEALSVFDAPFSLDLAEALVSIGTSFYEAVADLVDASWLVHVEPVDPSGEPRLKMWDSMRRFVRRQSGEERLESLRRKLVSTAAAHVRQLDAEIPKTGGDGALRLLRADETVITQAIEIGLNRAMTQTRELAVHTRWLARTAEHPETYLERLEAVLAASTGTPVELGELRAVVGELHARAGQMERAREYLEAAMKEVADGPPNLRAEVSRLSSAALAPLDPSAAKERLEAALELTTSGAADPVERGAIIERLGFLALRDFELDRARDLFAEASQLLSRNASFLLQGPVTIGLGYVAMRTGHIEGAVSAFASSVEIFERSAAPRREAEARFNHGVGLLALGDRERARAELLRARQIWERCADEHHRPITSVKLALLAIEARDFEEARQELDAAIAAGQHGGDWNNRAIAEAGLGLVELAEVGRVQSLGRVTAALRDLDFASDPDAAAAALLLEGIGHVERGDLPAARESLKRLSGLLRLVAEEDAYLNGVIETIASVGQAWFAAETERGSIATASRGVRARVPSLLADARRAQSEIARLPNPFVRIACRALKRRLDRPDTRETIDASITFLGMMPPSAADAFITVHRLGYWFRLGDADVIDLLARRPFRLILRSIVQSHLEDGLPGRTVEELIEAGWPDEYIEETAARNRVYNAIRQLREMGLEGILVTDDAGYRFSVRTALQVVDTTPSQVSPIHRE